MPWNYCMSYMQQVYCLHSSTRSVYNSKKNQIYTYSASQEALGTVAYTNDTSYFYVCENNYVQTNFCAQIRKS